MGDIRIGISGWRYPPWRGIFYPPGLAQRRELQFASHAFSTIELNGSFYGLQRPESYANWYATTPRGFTFSVKASRYITHILRLRELEPALANFLASGLFELKEKLGPILWQFPPSMRFDPEIFEHFLRALPHDTEHARRLALGHDPRMKGRASVDVAVHRRLRHAVEIRNDSFVCRQFVDLLHRYRVALVVADTAGKWPDQQDVTADFVYARLHGDRELYASGYTDSALDTWGARIRAWAKGSEAPDAKRIGDPARKAASRDVYCYFDNDIKVRAPADAKTLMRKLGLPLEPVAP